MMNLNRFFAICCELYTIAKLWYSNTFGKLFFIENYLLSKREYIIIWERIVIVAYRS